MGFLYPLFLLAGLALAIPVAIHLFDLRRYKTVLFPHTRFLREVQLTSRKQSKVRYKWLLALRLLFLASLILAFAQPFFRQKTAVGQSNRLQVLYLDNSYSLSLKQGARSLLDVAKEAIRKQVQGSNARFILLTNDRPLSYSPLPADKVLAALGEIEPSATPKSSSQILTTIQGLVESEGAGGADVFWFSDFQRSAFDVRPQPELVKNLSFTGILTQATEKKNIFIDTAFLTSPVLQADKNNELVVRTRLVGDAPKEPPVLQLVINGQIKSAATPAFNAKGESVDTLSFQTGTGGWQNMALTINDAAIRFDDTFRIAARSTPGLSVLVLNEGSINPYIQAAFQPYSGFRVTQADVNGIPASLQDYNLIILNGITRLPPAAGKMLEKALAAGQSICLFPGKTTDAAGLTESFRYLADLQVDGIDTAAQTASTLQQGSDLARDLFERIPPNVQLPVANWHYRIRAGLNANQQSILSFRNGDPLLAQYTPSKGRLYVLSTTADLPSGNFPGSYFFVPFLYQMAVQSRSGDVYALTAGKGQAAYLSLSGADERRMVHLYGNGIDAIPPQRPSGAGLDVFVDGAVQQPGFYRLAAAGSDSVGVALNADRSESLLDTWTPEALRQEWTGKDTKWLRAGDINSSSTTSAWGGFPLWKVCAILALLALAGETYVLASQRRNAPAPTI